MSTTLAVNESAEIQVTPMHLIERAAAQGASIEQMQQLFELKLRVEADEAKKAFHEAFTAFKAETIRIVRDKENTQYSRKATTTEAARPAMYTSLENMVATVTPFLSKHDLSHNWEIGQANGAVTVTCVLTHTLGYSKSVSMSGPPDDSGAKNKLQQIKSSVTYLKVSTFESVCGLASAFGSTNDDGNGAGAKPVLGDEEFIALRDNIEAAETMAELKKFFDAAYKAATAIGDKDAVTRFMAMKDKRKGELQ
jgi:hypothetical protein